LLAAGKIKINPKQGQDMKLKFHMVDIAGIGALILIFLLLAGHHYVSFPQSQIQGETAPSASPAPGAGQSPVLGPKPVSESGQSPALDSSPKPTASTPAPSSKPVSDDSQSPVPDSGSKPASDSGQNLPAASPAPVQADSTESTPATREELNPPPGDGGEQ
jgi:hypothetical protein